VDDVDQGRLGGSAEDGRDLRGDLVAGEPLQLYPLDPALPLPPGEEGAKR
jgi:hypothetical protein